ncbi:uncharacterized protein BCR38DRAFT_395620 [Pseudomassariella vexata]|uniref:CST complex subunit STN1 n=1 Tax=Pseudomassariella vexata TaxID=1141098 RepID=A0A1Y2DTG9_9PEZI|nr:uncharacterized protein BCR38DRAFT_395620 [Pseudomassariella vexata]ORY62571.1 hypothetical protein BCR38DRAFT_395620 [Pseudomassariella vexata]
MTSAAQLEYEYYPQYCFHLSPTINKWCPFRASDIQELRQHSGFPEKDEIFFHLNHPIRWVRVVGVVIAIDEYYGRRTYTVDDSTGVNIECSLQITNTSATTNATGDAEEKAPIHVQKPNPYPEIDVGLVVEVRGSLKLFRDQKQIKIEKLQRVPTTNQEVQFWNKIRSFRTDVLSQPWVVDSNVLRRLKKEENRSAYEEERQKRKKRSRGDEVSGTGPKVKSRLQPRRAIEDTRVKKSYPPSKLSEGITITEGKYDALGL